MLVLSRNRQESVVIGGCAAFDRILKVTVLQVCGGTVRLGFEIDSDIPVHRAEVWNRIHGFPVGKSVVADLENGDPRN